MKKVKEVIGIEKVTPPIDEFNPEEENAKNAIRRAGMQTVNTSMKGILQGKENTLIRKKLLGD